MFLPVWALSPALLSTPAQTSLQGRYCIASARWLVTISSCSLRLPWPQTRGPPLIHNNYALALSSLAKTQDENS